MANVTLPTIQGTGAFVPKEACGTQSGIAQIENIFTTLFGFLTVVAGLAFLVYFVIGAISWITAGSDEKKVDDAKKFMTNGVIGLIVIVAAYSIIYIVGSVLGINILNPEEALKNALTGNTSGTINCK